MSISKGAERQLFVSSTHLSHQKRLPPFPLRALKHSKRSRPSLHSQHFTSTVLMSGKDINGSELRPLSQGQQNRRLATEANSGLFTTFVPRGSSTFYSTSLIPTNGKNKRLFSSVSSAFVSKNIFGPQMALSSISESSGIVFQRLGIVPKPYSYSGSTLRRPIFDLRFSQYRYLQTTNNNDPQVQANGSNSPPSSTDEKNLPTEKSSHEGVAAASQEGAQNNAEQGIGFREQMQGISDQMSDEEIDKLIQSGESTALDQVVSSDSFLNIPVNEALRKQIFARPEEVISEAPLSWVSVEGTQIDPVGVMYRIFHEFPTVVYTADFISMIKYSYDLPWYVVISCVAMSIHVVTFPLSRWSIKEEMKRARSMQIRILQSLYDKEKDPLRRAKIKASINRTLKQLNYKPWARFVPMLVQVPISFNNIFAIRKICYLDPSTQLGGILWFWNLTLPDPLMRLCWLHVALSLLVFELHARFREWRGVYKIMRYGWPVFILTWIPALTGLFPVAVHWYWVSSGLVGIVKAFLLLGKVMLNRVVMSRIRSRILPGDDRQSEYEVILDENYNIIPQNTTKVAPAKRLFEKFQKLTPERQEQFQEKKLMDNFGLTEVTQEQLEKLPLDRLTEFEMTLNIFTNQQTTEEIMDRLADKITNQLTLENQKRAIEAMDAYGLVSGKTSGLGSQEVEWSKVDFSSLENLTRLETLVNELIVNQGPMHFSMVRLEKLTSDMQKLTPKSMGNVEVHMRQELKLKAHERIPPIRDLSVVQLKRLEDLTLFHLRAQGYETVTPEDHLDVLQKIKQLSNASAEQALQLIRSVTPDNLPSSKQDLEALPHLDPRQFHRVRKWVVSRGIEEQESSKQSTLVRWFKSAAPPSPAREEIEKTSEALAKLATGSERVRNKLERYLTDHLSIQGKGYRKELESITLHQLKELQSFLKLVQMEEASSVPQGQGQDQKK